MKVSDLKQVLEKPLLYQGLKWTSSLRKNRDPVGKSELEPRSPDSQAGAASTTKPNTLQALSLSLPHSLSAPLPFPAPASSPGLETESISFPASSEVRDEADRSPHLLSCLPSQDLPPGAPAWAFLDQGPRTLPAHLAQGPFLLGLHGAAAAALFQGKGRRSAWKDYLDQATWITFLFPVWENTGLWEGPKASCNSLHWTFSQEVVLKRKNDCGYGDDRDHRGRIHKGTGL